MTDEIAVFGAGGHAKVVIEAVRAAFPRAPVVLVDDSQPDRMVLGLAVSGDRNWLVGHRPTGGVVPALGLNSHRSALMEWLGQQGLSARAIIHPSAIVSPSARIDCGAFLAPAAVVNADVSIGEGAIINTAASVDHDCEIGAAAHVAPGAHLCGSVRVGCRTLIGAGATVIPGVRIGDDVVIGAGSTVIRDVPDGERWVGSPARPV